MCRKRKCRLLVTHDDYSMMSKLPRQRTSVVTILRDPVDRIFSTYEFSVEVAARFLVHPNLTSATQMAGRLRAKTSGVSTLDIWPWKYLVPWMREDLFARVCLSCTLFAWCISFCFSFCRFQDRHPFLCYLFFFIVLSSRCTPPSMVHLITFWVFFFPYCN